MVVPSLTVIDHLEKYRQAIKFFKAQGSVIEGRRSGAAVKQPSQAHFVTFSLKAPEARSVELAGDFNLWQPQKFLLKRGKPKGQWELTVPLAAGQYLYLFKVDGQWKLDPANARTRRYGDTVSSVLSVP